MRATGAQSERAGEDSRASDGRADENGRGQADEEIMSLLPMWVLALPTWLVVFIVIYALATLYVAIRYREVRKFLAGAFFVSSGTCWYLWETSVSLPVVLPYAGTVSVETPEISGQRAIVHFILFLLCFYFGFIRKPKERIAS